MMGINKNKVIVLGAILLFAIQTSINIGNGNDIERIYHDSQGTRLKTDYLQQRDGLYKKTLIKMIEVINAQSDVIDALSKRTKELERSNGSN